MLRISDRTERLLEFVVIGLAMGITEDLLAVWISTGEPITWSVFGIVVAIALPFAFLSEYVVDHPKFWKRAFGIGKQHPPEDNPSQTPS
jgi:hypothetical protein